MGLEREGRDIYISFGLDFVGMACAARLIIPSFPGSEPRYFNASIVTLYMDANLARFAAWVRVALKMRVAFSFNL